MFLLEELKTLNNVEYHYTKKNAYIPLKHHSLQLIEANNNRWKFQNVKKSIET